MSLLQNWFSLINFTPGYFHPSPFCLLLYSREESSCINSFFSYCNSYKCLWFLSSLSSKHRSRGPLTADLRRFLVNYWAIMDLGYWAQMWKAVDSPMCILPLLIQDLGHLNCWLKAYFPNGSMGYNMNWDFNSLILWAL